MGIKIEEKEGKVYIALGKKERKLRYLRWAVQMASQMRNSCAHEAWALRSQDGYVGLDRVTTHAPVQVKETL